MLFFCRIAKYELRCLSNKSQRRHYRIPHACLVNCSSSLARNCYVENPAKSIYKKLTELCNNARFFAAPVQMKPKKEDKDAGAPRLNDRIKAEIVRLVYPNKAHLIVSRNEALERARKLKLDLVEVQRNAKPPVCKIMDFHKEKYLQQIKEKDRAKGKADVAVRKGDCKEVRFTAKTEQKDLQMKADMVKRLMERGYRVKCMAMGTEDQDLGELLSRLSALIEDVAFVESGPRVEKKQAYAIVRHIKFGPSKKGAKKTFKAVDAATFNASSSNSTPGSAAESDGEIVFEEAESDSSSESSPDSWSVFDASDDFEKVFDLGDDPLPISSSPVDMETSSSSDRVKTVQSQQIEPTPPIGNRYQRSDLPNKPPHTKAMDFRSPFSESTPRPELRFTNREGLVRRPGINGSPLVGGTTQVAGPRHGQSLPGDSGSKGYGIFSTSKVESPGERIPRSEYNRNREENPSTPDLRGSQRSGGQEKW